MTLHQFTFFFFTVFDLFSKKKSGNNKVKTAPTFTIAVVNVVAVLSLRSPGRLHTAQLLRGRRGRWREEKGKRGGHSLVLQEDEIILFLETCRPETKRRKCAFFPFFFFAFPPPAYGRDAATSTI